MICQRVAHRYFSPFFLFFSVYHKKKNRIRNSCFFTVLVGIYFHMHMFYRIEMHETTVMLFDVECDISCSRHINLE
jgi:hypothetical protein